MHKCKTILALILTAALMLSFASVAFALEQHDDKATNPCGHIGRSRTSRSYTIYSQSSLGCVVHLRVYYACNTCNDQFYIDEYIGVQDHIRQDYAKGHITGSNRHTIGVRCGNCKVTMGSDYTVTCYGPPCTALPFSGPGYTLQIN